MGSRLRNFALAAGVLAAYTIPQTADAQQRVRSSCTRDRCVYYDPHGKRLGSAERSEGRTVVRDWPRQQVRAKIVEERRGSYRVEKPRR